jgi:hypothetical protein
MDQLSHSDSPEEEGAAGIPRGRDPLLDTLPPRPDDIASISDFDFDFDFGKGTAEVFGDMLDRSIPEYRELQRMIGELAATFAEPDTRIYDLGCSNGILSRP